MLEVGFLQKQSLGYKMHIKINNNESKVEKG